MSKSETTQEKKCPACAMRLSDYRRTSLLGCPTCYQTFAAELSPLIASVQEGMAHVGKVPVAQRVAAQVASLRRVLEKAVAEQNFEEAARLRDKIRALTGGQQTGEHASGRT